MMKSASTSASSSFNNINNNTLLQDEPIKRQTDASKLRMVLSQNHSISLAKSDIKILLTPTVKKQQQLMTSDDDDNDSETLKARNDQEDNDDARLSEKRALLLSNIASLIDHHQDLQESSPQGPSTIHLRFLAHITANSPSVCKYLFARHELPYFFRKLYEHAEAEQFPRFSCIFSIITNIIYNLGLTNQDHCLANALYHGKDQFGEVISDTVSRQECLSDEALKLTAGFKQDPERASKMIQEAKDLLIIGDHDLLHRAKEALIDALALNIEKLPQIIPLLFRVHVNQVLKLEDENCAQSFMEQFFEDCLSLIECSVSPTRYNIFEYCSRASSSSSSFSSRSSSSSSLSSCSSAPLTDDDDCESPIASAAAPSSSSQKQQQLSPVNEHILNDVKSKLCLSYGLFLIEFCKEFRQAMTCLESAQLFSTGAASSNKHQNDDIIFINVHQEAQKLIHRAKCALNNHKEANIDELSATAAAKFSDLSSIENKDRNSIDDAFLDRYLETGDFSEFKIQLQGLIIREHEIIENEKETRNTIIEEYEESVNQDLWCSAVSSDIQTGLLLHKERQQRLKNTRRELDRQVQFESKKRSDILQEENNGFIHKLCAKSSTIQNLLASSKKNSNWSNVVSNNNDNSNKTQQKKEWSVSALKIKMNEKKNRDEEDNHHHNQQTSSTNNINTTTTSSSNKTKNKSNTNDGSHSTNQVSSNNNNNNNNTSTPALQNAWKKIAQQQTSAATAAPAAVSLSFPPLLESKTKKSVTAGTLVIHQQQKQQKQKQLVFPSTSSSSSSSAPVAIIVAPKPNYFTLTTGDKLRQHRAQDLFTRFQAEEKEFSFEKRTAAASDNRKLLRMGGLAKFIEDSGTVPPQFIFSDDRRNLEETENRRLLAEYFIEYRCFPKLNDFWNEKTKIIYMDGKNKKREKLALLDKKKKELENNRAALNKTSVVCITSKKQDLQHQKEEQPSQKKNNNNNNKNNTNNTLEASSSSKTVSNDNNNKKSNYASIASNKATVAATTKKQLMWTAATGSSSSSSSASSISHSSTIRHYAHWNEVRTTLLADLERMVNWTQSSTCSSASSRSSLSSSHNNSSTCEVINDDDDDDDGVVAFDHHQNTKVDGVIASPAARDDGVSNNDNNTFNFDGFFDASNDQEDDDDDDDDDNNNTQGASRERNSSPPPRNPVPSSSSSSAALTTNISSLERTLFINDIDFIIEHETAIRNFIIRFSGERWEVIVSSFKYDNENLKIAEAVLLQFGKSNSNNNNNDSNSRENQEQQTPIQDPLMGRSNELENLAHQAMQENTVIANNNNTNDDDDDDSPATQKKSSFSRNPSTTLVALTPQRCVSSTDTFLHNSSNQQQEAQNKNNNNDMGALHQNLFLGENSSNSITYNISEDRNIIKFHHISRNNYQNQNYQLSSTRAMDSSSLTSSFSDIESMSSSSNNNNDIEGLSWMKNNSEDLNVAILSRGAKNVADNIENINNDDDDDQFAQQQQQQQLYTFKPNVANLSKSLPALSKSVAAPFASSSSSSFINNNHNHNHPVPSTSTNQQQQPTSAAASPVPYYVDHPQQHKNNNPNNNNDNHNNNIYYYQYNQHQQQVQYWGQVQYFGQYAHHHHRQNIILKNNSNNNNRQPYNFHHHHQYHHHHHHHHQQQQLKTVVGEQRTITPPTIGAPAASSSMMNNNNNNNNDKSKNKVCTNKLCTNKLCINNNRQIATRENFVFLDGKTIELRVPDKRAPLPTLCRGRGRTSSLAVTTSPPPPLTIKDDPNYKRAKNLQSDMFCEIRMMISSVIEQQQQPSSPSSSSVTLSPLTQRVGNSAIMRHDITQKTLASQDFLHRLRFLGWSVDKVVNHNNHAFLFLFENEQNNLKARNCFAAIHEMNAFYVFNQLVDRLGETASYTNLEKYYGVAYAVWFLLEDMKNRQHSQE